MNIAAFFSVLGDVFILGGLLILILAHVNFARDNFNSQRIGCQYLRPLLRPFDEHDIKFNCELTEKQCHSGRPWSKGCPLLNERKR